MDYDGQRGSATPSTMLASLLNKRAKLQEELRSIERQVYDMETSYLQDPSQCGHVLKGFEGFLSSSKNTALYELPVLTLFSLVYFFMECRAACSYILITLKRSRKFQPEDRLFSLSSVTSPAVCMGFVLLRAEEVAAGRDDGKSYYGAGRSKGGGYFANGQGKPKKGRVREAKRIRHSSEPDFDYDDDPDVTF
ncbi:chromatin modification-related protein MEAF6-like isoform X2 [Gossypium australe]|uniref:Chromatin modification-related protein MEAF6-like isoform X2 n=1 Tax=Gossypium australe TaxID=47621 RepID=A0A5B6VIM1_9ROSI|nr:chromatin modification-related protein MEAF6-like isoform X2 [Gossypium australe]